MTNHTHTYSLETIWEGNRGDPVFSQILGTACDRAGDASHSKSEYPLMTHLSLTRLERLLIVISLSQVGREETEGNFGFPMSTVRARM